MTNQPPTRAEQYLERSCYGKQYADHETVCRVCPLDAAFRALYQETVEACAKIATSFAGRRECETQYCLGYDDAVKEIATAIRATVGGKGEV